MRCCTHVKSLWRKTRAYNAKKKKCLKELQICQQEDQKCCSVHPQGGQRSISSIRYHLYNKPLGKLKPRKPLSERNLQTVAPRPVLLKPKEYNLMNCILYSLKGLFSVSGYFKTQRMKCFAMAML